MAAPTSPAFASADGGGFTAAGRPIWGLTSWPFRFLFHHASRLVSAGNLRRLEPSDLYDATELDVGKVRPVGAAGTTVAPPCGRCVAAGWAPQPL